MIHRDAQRPHVHPSGRAGEEIESEHCATACTNAPRSGQNGMSGAPQFPPVRDVGACVFSVLLSRSRMWIDRCLSVTERNGFPSPAPRYVVKFSGPTCKARSPAGSVPIRTYSADLDRAGPSKDKSIFTRWHFQCLN
jgi:hypothetical protein